MEHKRCEAETTQSGVDKGLPQMSSKNDSGSPATIQKMKVDVEDFGSKIESPTPEKPESRRKGTVISSLVRNLHAEKYQDKTADDHSEDEDDGDILSLSGSQSSVSGSTDVLGKFPKDKSNELPEKYKTLLNLFNRLESSIRLLRLRKKMTTFKNISTQVEILTKRKFLYSHLAQMKHLFPHAIQIKNILLHDEKSLCMYPDMEITLLMDAVECRNPDQSPSMAVCQAFHSSLLSFLDTHPKDIEIPEAMLPEPFNLREKLSLETLPNGSSAEPLLQSSTETRFSNASHFPRSFKKLMSQKIIAEGNERTQLLSDPAAVSSLSTDDTKESRGSPNKQDKDISVPVMNNITATPKHRMISCYQDSTPKQGTSNSLLMAETPAMQTPKRPLPTPLDKLESSTEQASEARLTSSARRSLMYSPSKFEGNPSDCDAITIKSGQDGAIHNAKHQSTAKERCLLGEETTTFMINSLVEKDSVICCSGNDKINQVSRGDSQEKLALPVTFDTVCMISQSTNNSLITKQELVHKILANNLEIEETREVEEQLVILEELVPDWISKKVVPGGEILYRIKQIPDQKSVRARLVEAI